MDNENHLVLGFARENHWHATLISCDLHRSADLQTADQWLAHQANVVLAIAAIETQAAPTPLAIEDIIWHAVERHRDNVSSEVRETTS